MNLFVGIGNLARDTEIKTVGQNDTVICNFTIAVAKRKDKDGNQSADFLPCVSFGRVAETINKYFSKGSRIAITGRVSTRNYVNKDEQTIYVTEILVDSFEFAESKKSQGNHQEETYIKDEDSTELPFDL